MLNAHCSFGEADCPGDEAVDHTHHKMDQRHKAAGEVKNIIFHSRSLWVTVTLVALTITSVYTTIVIATHNSSHYSS